jgi:hypothetical protein
MRLLKFIVEGQTIKPDPRCDFSGLVPGTAGYLKAEFNFSKEWTSTPKVVAFYSRLGNEYPPQALKDGRTCLIPAEALQKRVFKVQVLGQNGLVTNKLEIDQKGG